MGLGRRTVYQSLLASILVSTLTVLIALFPHPSLESFSHNCRLWGITGDRIRGSAILQQLVSGRFSLDSLSAANDNGWGLAWIAVDDSAANVERGAPMALVDPRFDTVVAAMIASRPRIAVGHVRKCSSGLCDIPDPHPFVREKNSRQWLLAHNGTINKGALLGLIRPEYLAANPPQYGVNESEWIDTDLYLIFILQTLEDHNFAVKPALGEVIARLRPVAWPIPLLNFVLTDGTTLWAYCEGNTLCYTYEEGDSAFAAVMSQPPTIDAGSWQTLTDGDLVTLAPGATPVVEAIETYFGPLAVTGEAEPLPHSISLSQNYPNPFNVSTSIRYEVHARTAVRLAVYDVLGRRVKTLVDEVQAVGSYVTEWNGRSEDGHPVASGVYFCRLETTGESAVRKMVVMK
jgi:predicted glutamine amidotransferase